MSGEELTPRLREELSLALARERDDLKRRARSFAEAKIALSGSQGEESDSAGSDADVASDLAEEELSMTLSDVEAERLREVEAALQRMTAGAYGTCQACSKPIVVDRLFAVPWTRFCVECAARHPARTM